MTILTTMGITYIVIFTECYLTKHMLLVGYIVLHSNNVSVRSGERENRYLEYYIKVIPMSRGFLKRYVFTGPTPSIHFAFINPVNQLQVWAISNMISPVADPWRGPFTQWDNSILKSPINCKCSREWMWYVVVGKYFLVAINYQRHDLETLAVLIALWEANSAITSKGSVPRIFDMFVVEPNNLLNNWSDFRPFYTQKHPCGITAMETGHPMET